MEPEKQVLQPTPEFQSANLSNIQLDEPIIWVISECLTSIKWTELGHELEIPQSKLDEIKEEYRHRHRECAFHMLLAWHEYNPTFIVQDLFNALDKIKWKSSIIEIEKCLDKYMKNRSCRGKDVEEISCRRKDVESLSSPATSTLIYPIQVYQLLDIMVNIFQVIISTLQKVQNP